MKIELEENPSTGYKWFVDFQDAGVEIIDWGYMSRREFYPPRAGEELLIGGGGIRLFEFKGDGLACLTYRQPWEGGAEGQEITISVCA